MRTAAIVLALLELAVAALVILLLLSSGSDHATLGLDVAAAGAIALIAALTVLPALVLLRLGRSPLAALLFAIGFPVLVVLLVLGFMATWLY